MKTKRKLLFLFQINIFKTIYYNFKLLPLKKAIKFPIIVCFNTKIKNLKKRNFNVLQNPSTASIIFGINLLEFPTLKTIINIDGQIEIEKNLVVGKGTYLLVGSGAFLKIGNNLEIKGNSKIFCLKEIKFGTNCLLSWNVTIMDSDWHKIFNSNNKLINEKKGINIGDHNWIGMNVTILKGSELGNNNVIAANSILSGRLLYNNSILSSNNIIKENIHWQK